MAATPAILNQNTTKIIRRSVLIITNQIWIKSDYNFIQWYFPNYFLGIQYNDAFEVDCFSLHVIDFVPV